MAQRRQPGAHPDAQPPQIGIAAAARVVDIEGKAADGYRRKAKSEAWQREGWTYFDILGEVKQPTYYIANACSLARIYVATQDNPEQDPGVPPAGTPGMFEATDALDRLRQGAKGGMGGLTRNFTVNAKVAGECYLVGIPEQPEIAPGGTDSSGRTYPDGREAQGERWSIMSVSQVESKGEGRGLAYTYKEDPNETQGKPFPPDTVVIRMWQEHPEFGELADCALRALLGECEQLLILSRMVKAAGRSRLASAGILAIASELDPLPNPQPGADADEQNRQKPFVDRLMEAAEQNILNEGSAGAVVPIVVKGPHQLIKDGIVHIDFARPLDALALEQRREIIQRMGQGSDVPMEILVGLKNINHWPCDEATEVFTRDRGFVTHDQLGAGDVVLSLDHKTGLSQWVSLDGVRRERVENQAMVRVHARGVAALTTPDHRWPVLRDGCRVWTTSADLRPTDRIIRAAPTADLPTQAKYEDAFVELAAWFVTEGTCTWTKPDHCQVRIGQSHAANPERVARIRRALRGLFGPSRESLYRGKGVPRGSEVPPAWREVAEPRGMTLFHLNKTAFAPLLDVMESWRSKVLSRDFVLSLTQAQLGLLLEVCALGDGTLLPGGGLSVNQRDPAQLAPLALAAVLAGRPVSFSDQEHRDGFSNGTQHYLRVPAKRGFDVAVGKTTIEPYTGIIFCPRVPVGASFLARRDGTVYFTGNTSFQVDQSLWDRYGHPTMLLWAESLTVGYLRPMMEEAGVSPDVAARWMVWFDPGGAVVQPDRTATVMESLDRFLISWEAARTILSFSDSDAPSEDEIRRRIDIATAMKGGGGGGGDTSGSNPGGGNPPNDGVPPTTPNGTNGHAASTDPLALLKQYVDLTGSLPPALAAAAAHRRQPVGRRLMQIDRTLRTRLLEATDAAMLRALERAGARVRNRAKKNARLSTAVASLAAWQVPAKLGQTMVASLGYTDDELLADSFDDLGPKFLDRVAKAQGEALNVMAADLGLDDGEIDAIKVSQQRDREAAWNWLAAALVSLGLTRLYSPNPEAPARGEFDASSMVPAGIIREAMARAGGAGGVESVSGAPPGGVALGDLVLDTFARHGQVTDGWEWVYGDPSSRTSPFEPHENLDGVTFATWDDDVLLNDGGFPDVDRFRPGDHNGCQCDFVALGLGSDESEASPEEVAAA